jgi:hypothetical protein
MIAESLMFFNFRRITLIGVVVHYQHVYLFRTWGKLDTKEVKESKFDNYVNIVYILCFTVRGGVLMTPLLC